MKAKAYSPAGLSSFFEARNGFGEDPASMGARGGGFLLTKGITTEVTAEPSKRNEVKVYINGLYSRNASTSRRAAQYVLELVGGPFKVTIKHEIKVPIAAGFGTSGAGALTASLALSKIFNLNLSVEEVGMIAHKAEIACKTGLGTVPPLVSGGGCVVTVKPGGPGKATIKKIPVKPGLKIISGVFKAIETKRALLSRAGLEKVNKAGERALERILADPCLENFLKSAKNFAVESELATSRVLKLIKEVERAGALGAAQNMIGEAVHAVTEEDNLAKVLTVFKKFIPSGRMVVAEISKDPVKFLN
ncbi:TPA: hypothetical protein EYP26_01465 [Candidatus Bathyarchaeota archaeon]|nr:hypothetical protein [Candidatus Bathyarchaeota archaeon]